MTSSSRRSVALSPWHCSFCDKRAEIKATLEAQADEGTKIGVSDVTKAAGAQWNALKEAIDAAEKRIADGDELTDEERDTYKNQNDEMAKYVAVSEASKKEAAEYNEAKAKEITASHELQLENAKAAHRLRTALLRLLLLRYPSSCLPNPPLPRLLRLRTPLIWRLRRSPKAREGEVSEEELEEETKEQPKEETKEQPKEETKEQPKEETKEKSDEDVFGPDSDDEEEECETELEEFTHEGQTLFKMADEENEGCFIIADRAEGGEEDEYEQWGTMDADGNITKDDE